MKKLLLIFVLGCNQITFDCQCSRTEYYLNDGVWQETKKDIKKTDCQGEAYFDVNYTSDTTRTVINCQ